MQIREPHFLLPEYHASTRTVFGTSGVVHTACVLMLATLFWLSPGRRIDSPIDRGAPINLVYVPRPGASGGGGGGGGNRSLTPPRTTTTAAVRPPKPLPQPVPDPAPEPPPAAELAAIVPQQTMAALGAVPNLIPDSRGPGDGPGARNGREVGIGTGDDGPGVGRLRGPGDDRIFGVGNGVTEPVLLRKAQPSYTAEGMLNRVQGEARLNCVVLATGRVGACEIIQSLDQNRYGLDAEALKAASQFQFRPARRAGEPVPVRVIIVLEFNVR